MALYPRSSRTAPRTIGQWTNNRAHTIGLASAVTFAALLGMPSQGTAHAQEAPVTPATTDAATDAAREAITDRVKAAIAFTKDLTDRANAAFVETTDEALQLTNFQAVLNEGLALDYLGRFMLGSTARTLTEAQSARYDAVFPRYITRLYAEQFKDIAGKDLTINDATPFGRRDVIVRTQFLRDDGSPVNVDWRARKLRTEGHKMLDIIVSGVSIMTVKREEFSGFIAANGVDALIERLEEEASA
ncbi:MAG: ABC transporter substrate-binding protein [Pseudomonadota bacterium]